MTATCPGTGASLPGAPVRTRHRVHHTPATAPTVRLRGRGVVYMPGVVAGGGHPGTAPADLSITSSHDWTVHLVRAPGTRVGPGSYGFTVAITDPQGFTVAIHTSYLPLGRRIPWPDTPHEAVLDIDTFRLGPLAAAHDPAHPTSVADTWARVARLHALAARVHPGPGDHPWDRTADVVTFADFPTLDAARPWAQEFHIGWVAHNYQQAGFTPADAKPWYHVGVLAPHARAAADAGWTPPDAAALHRADRAARTGSPSMRQAAVSARAALAAWVDVSASTGLAPERAIAAAAAGISPLEAIRFTPEDWARLDALLALQGRAVVSR